MPAEAKVLGPRTRALVLLGVESSGKSALFRGLTGQATGDEANFRGSTVVCRTGRVALVLADASALEVVDTPGVQHADDSVTTRLALQAVGRADVVGLVVRGSSLQRDLGAILAARTWDDPRDAAPPTVLIVTFADRAPAGLDDWLARLTATTGVPTVALDARRLSVRDAARIVHALERAAPLDPARMAELPALPARPPRRTLLEDGGAGAPLALALFAALFALPVYVAYALADAAHPWLDTHLLDPVRAWATTHLPAIGYALLAGDYGLLTLGAYSFLWAFPVVLLLGVAMALTDEIGLRDRLAQALDPAMRRLGLSGRDLLPVLGGFGCNVVAVMHSRGCSRAHHQACVSLIAFGSSCSYQLGASLSVFAAAGHPGLFVPLVLTVFSVGLLHSRLHLPRTARALRPATLSVVPATFLQLPTWRGLRWRVRAMCTQFLLQAMPSFLGICLVSALLAHFGVLALLVRAVAPVLEVAFGVPAAAAPAIVFSLLRKDGILLLNAPGAATGAAPAMDAGALFLAVFLAATLGPCLVTLYTIGRELGAGAALRLAGCQLRTAVVAGLALSLLLRLA